MGIPVKARWWVLTLLIAGVLVLISALALDRRNVVWVGFEPHCPHCRHEVRDYSSRCADCRGEFDWVIAPREDSPVSHDSLSVLEAEWVHTRVQETGLDVAAARVAAATGLSPEGAAAYLQSVGRGDCGWCGGTTRDLSGADPAPTEPCPCCLGTGDSVACGGDRRVRLGDPSAQHALTTYLSGMEDLRRSKAPREDRAREARRLAEDFLSVHAGSQEAASILFWPDFRPERAKVPPGILAPGVRHASKAARERLDKVLEALQPRP